MSKMLGSKKPANKPSQAANIDSLFVDMNAIYPSSSSSAPNNQRTSSAAPQSTSALPSPATSVTSTSSPAVRPVVYTPTTHEEEEFAMHVYELVNMGFTTEHATIALKRCSNKLPDAITFCLDHDDDTMRQFMEEERQLSAIRERNAANAGNTSSSQSTASKPESKSVFKRMIGLKGKERKAVTTVPVSPPSSIVSVEDSAPPAENPNYIYPAAIEDDFLLVNERTQSFRTEETSAPAPTVVHSSQSASNSAAVSSPQSVTSSAPAKPAKPVASGASPAPIDNYALAMSRIQQARQQDVSPTPAPALTVITPTSPAAVQDTSPYALAMAQIQQARMRGASETPTPTPEVSAEVETPPLQRSESPVVAPKVNTSRPPPPPPRNANSSSAKLVEESTIEVKANLTSAMVPAPIPPFKSKTSSESSMQDESNKSTAYSGYDPSSELSEFGIDDSYHYKPAINPVLTTVNSATGNNSSKNPEVVSVSSFLGGLVGVVGAVQNEFMESTSSKHDTNLLNTLKSKTSEIIENFSGKGVSTSTETEVTSVQVDNASTQIDDSEVSVVNDEEQEDLPINQTVDEEVFQEQRVDECGEPSLEVEGGEANNSWEFTSPQNNQFSEFNEADETIIGAEEFNNSFYGSNQGNSASIISVRAEVAAITSSNTPRRTTNVPVGGVPTAFVANVSASQMSVDESTRSSISRSSDNNEGDDNTLNVSMGNEEDGLFDENERARFETESLDFTSGSVDGSSSFHIASASAASQNIQNPRQETGSRMPNEVTSGSPNRTPTSAASSTTSSPSHANQVVHTELYRLSRNFATHVRKRKHLEFHVTPQEGGKFKASITMKQTKLHKNENSPQGARANVVTIGLCATRELANDLCLSLAPPEWTGKRESLSCSSCNVQFTMFTKKGHHCRNCGFIVCTNCSNKNWPSTMVPSTYHDSEKYIRVCKTCQTGTEMFIKALRDGDFHAATFMFDYANINLHYPFGIYVNNAYPVHCAAVGGNLELLKWLIEVKKCSISEKATRKPLVYGRNNLSVLAVAAQAGHVDIMRYLVREKKCSVLEIQELSIMHRALHMALEAPGPMPDYVPPKRRDNEEVLVGNSSPNPSSHGFVSTSQGSSSSSPLNNSVSASQPLPPVPSGATQRPTTGVAGNNTNRRSSIDNANLSNPQRTETARQHLPAAANSNSSGIAERGLLNRQQSNASNTSSSSIVDSNVQAFYDQHPVHIATHAEVAVGQVFTADSSADDAPVTASAFLADDVVFAVADIQGHGGPSRQISDRWVAVANPYDSNSRVPAAAQANRNAPLPELIVESSVPRQSNGGRWW